MNKNELTATVAQKLGCSNTEAENIVNSFIDTLSDNLVAGKKVQLTGFGTFEVRQRNGHRGYNPQTGEPIWIEPSTAVGFKASKALKETVNK